MLERIFRTFDVRCLRPKASGTLVVDRQFQRECIHLLDQSEARIQHCVNQLTHEQIWWRPGEGQNSIGIVLRHVAGNLQQWAICGISESPDFRDRDAEFSSPQQQTACQLLDKLSEVVARTRQLIVELSPETLTQPRTIQGFDVSVMGSLMHTIPHFVGHAHQIVTLSRLQLGKGYRFHWTPDAPRNEVPL